jgi:hypothetical protein
MLDYKETDYLLNFKNFLRKKKFQHNKIKNKFKILFQHFHIPCYPLALERIYQETVLLHNKKYPKN